MNHLAASPFLSEGPGGGHRPPIRVPARLAGQARLATAGRRFARARTRRRLAGMADHGFDSVVDEASYGFRLHLRTGLDGVNLGFEPAAANAPETEMVWELAPAPVGTGPGDRK